MGTTTDTSYTDTLSFTEIYSEYFPRMQRFARTYLIDKDEAENVVQDIFIYLWEHPSLLHGLRSPQAFLFTLVKRRCIDFLRKKIQLPFDKGSLDEVENQEFKYKLYSLEIFDESRLSEEEIGNLLYQAIEHLPERCRYIFVESKINHKKQQEIADELGLSVQTVKNQVVIATQKLRQNLKEYLPLLIFLIG